jgi:1,4-dihydroxy-2-naphthoate octaprenyltransferase
MLDVKPNIQTMSIYGRIKFWSFLVIGIICIFAGGYLYPYGPDKRPIAEFLLLIGIGQLLIFAVLFFLKNRRKNKKTASV